MNIVLQKNFFFHRSYSPTIIDLLKTVSGTVNAKLRRLISMKYTEYFVLDHLVKALT